MCVCVGRGVGEAYYCLPMPFLHFAPIYNHMFFFTQIVIENVEDKIILKTTLPEK